MTLAATLQSASPFDLAYLESELEWTTRARQKQVLPIKGWLTAVAISGRGFGKTLLGANWVRRCVGLYPGCVVHVIAPTHADLRGVVFGGPSGLIAQIPASMIRQINHSLFEVHMMNGSVIRGFSAESPDRMRGPQCHFVWGDEIAAWGLNAEPMLTNIDMSTRLPYRDKHGRTIQPQKLYTTTPRPLAWLKALLERRGTHVITGSTYENRANLADSFFDEIEQYEGTQIGRQELHGELIDIGEAAIIKRSWMRLWPASRPLPWFEFVFVSMDTAFSEKTFDKKTFEPDPTACSVWGVFAHEQKWNMLMLEAWHDSIGFPELVARAKREMKATYGRRSEVIFSTEVGQRMIHEQVRKPDLLIIEDKGSGISLRQMLSVEGIDSWPYNPGQADKLMRLHAVSHVARAGRVWMPESLKAPGKPRTWCEPFLDEVCVYSGPGTVKHDDFVDTFSQGARYFADRFLHLGVNEKIKPDTITVEVDLNDSYPHMDTQTGREVEAPYG